MLVSRLSIENFRGIKKAELHFSGHTLLIGGNNVGKSTVCEALDLVLGPDRLNRMSPVEEFDFYNATYLDTDGETVIPIRIEVVLVDLTDEVKTLCAANLELWHKNERRLLGEGEIESVDEGDVEFCLRLITLARYDIEEDQLVARTIYGRSGEGITEQEALLVSAQKMEENDAGLFQLDVAGICVVNADGVGNLEKLGAFFKEIGTPAFAVFDRNKRTPDQIATLKNVYEIAFEIQQTGAEALMAEETPLDRQWQYLEIFATRMAKAVLRFLPSGRLTKLFVD